MKIVFRATALFVLLGSVACGDPSGDISAGAPRPPASGPSLILISLDTLAATHVGAYGYVRDTSPNLDAWAGDATLFENAFSTAPKTAESHMSMFTSLYPSVHGVRTLADRKDARALSENRVSVVEILREHGYRTVGFHGGGNVSPELGFERGFDEYRKASKMSGMKSVMEWLGEEAGGDPFFLFYHTYFVHDPYTPMDADAIQFSDPDYDGPIPRTKDALIELAGGDGFPARHEAWWGAVDREDPAAVAHVVALYDDLIVGLDRRLKALFASIEAHVPNAIVIVVADHGEEFGEHGHFTHEQLSREVLRVPFAIRHPEKGRGRRVAQPVSTIDLAPTILDLLGIPPHAQFQGSSLASHLDGTGDERPLFAEWGPEQAAWIEGGLKLARTGAAEELYDLRADPEEQGDLLLLERSGERWAQVSEEWTQLRAALDARRDANDAAKSQPRRTSLSDETHEQLKALGYIEP